MKISARNVLKGKIVDVTKGATTSHVKIDVGGIIVTSSITNAAVDELKLAAGKDAYAVIKASDVMVGID
jgi:molybdopterin-binding protein